MKCPVCGSDIAPLSESCTICDSNWRLGQADCPAFFRTNKETAVARCELGMNHKEIRHRATNVRLYDGGPELTVSWFWPEHRPLKFGRSPDFYRRHGNA